MRFPWFQSASDSPVVPRDSKPKDPEYDDLVLMSSASLVKIWDSYSDVTNSRHRGVYNDIAEIIFDRGSAYTIDGKHNDLWWVYEKGRNPRYKDGALDRIMQNPRPADIEKAQKHTGI